MRANEFINEDKHSLPKDQQAAIEQPPAQQQPQAQQQEQVHPDLQAWMNDNPWFGTDQRKTQKAMGIAQILRADPENDGLQGRAFFDRVLADANDAFCVEDCYNDEMEKMNHGPDQH